MRTLTVRPSTCLSAWGVGRGLGTHPGRGKQQRCLVHHSCQIAQRPRLFIESSHPPRRIELRAHSAVGRAVLFPHQCFCGHPLCIPSLPSFPPLPSSSALCASSPPPHLHVVHPLTRSQRILRRGKAHRPKPPAHGSEHMCSAQRSMGGMVWAARAGGGSVQMWWWWE